MRFATHVLVLQLATVTAAVLVCAGLVTALSVQQLQGEAEETALAIARTVAEDADVRDAVAASSADPAVPSRKEGHEGLDFSAYVAAIDDVPGSFDLVVIDGRAREACLAAAVGRLAVDGMIVFDNSRRRRYRETIRRSGLDEQVFRGLTPTLPYPDQTSLLFLAGNGKGSPTAGRPGDTAR